MAQDWSVILLGGGSCTGKSDLARQLARRLDLVSIDADLIWIALQRAVPASVSPQLHAFLEDPSVWNRPTDELVDLYFDVSKYVCRTLAFMVAHHDRRGIPAVIEGSWILPEFAADVEKYLGPYDAKPLAKTVLPLFLHEESFEHLDLRLHQRGGDAYANQPLVVRESQSRLMFVHGNELQRRAEDLGMPVLQARPFDSLLGRAMSILTLTSA